MFKIAKPQNLFLLVLFSVTLLYLLFASETEMLGEDEATYFTLTRDFAEGDFPLFREDGRPIAYSILLSLISVPLFWIFGESMALSKMVVVIFGAMTALVIYLIGKKVNPLAGMLSAFLFLAIPLVSQFMLFNYTEVPIAFFSALITYLFLTMKNKQDAIFLGAITGLAFYAKFTALAFPIIFAAYSLILYFRGNKGHLKLILTYIIIFAIFIVPWAVKNMYFYGTPYIEGLGLLFKASSQYYLPDWVDAISKTITPSTDYFYIFGFLTTLLATMGAIYAYYSENKMLQLMTFIIILFVIIYNIRYIVFRSIEPRYLTVVFPQMALLGGSILAFLYERFKPQRAFLSKLGVLAISTFLIFTMIQTGTAVSQSVRYSTDYIAALEWINKNTPEDSLIFTAYDGSVKVFAERGTIWAVVVEFPDIMTTNDGAYIHSVLKKYDLDYILIWRSILYTNYVLPESNLIGIFTYNFLNVVNNDREHFTPVFSNSETIIFQIL